MVEADVVDVIDEVQEVAAVEEVLEVADFEPAVEPIATSEVVPVAEIEAAEIVEVSDFFDGRSPKRRSLKFGTNRKSWQPMP